MLRHFLLITLVLTCFLSSAVPPREMHLPFGMKFGMNAQELTQVLGKKVISESKDESIEYKGVVYQNRPAILKSYFKNNQLYMVSIEMQAKTDIQADFNQCKQELSTHYGQASKESGFDARLQAATCQWNYKNGFSTLVLADQTLEVFFVDTSDVLTAQVTH
ncbi:hypothetical protein QE390_004623 [Siphonobacter sp. SORGH_AS 1065]|nr:hypothetical protein [Siphonobacter sp. SORGH_AS_1065]